MDETKQRGVERLSAEDSTRLGEGALRAPVTVGNVRQDRRAMIREMHADLMCPPGL